MFDLAHRCSLHVVFSCSFRVGSSLQGGEELAVVDVVGAVRALDAPVVRESKAISRSVVVLPEVRLNERRPVRS